MHQHPAEAKQMAERGHVHVHDKFTFERMVERTEAVYLSILENR
jgi:hypothetical protein